MILSVAALCLPALLQSASETIPAPRQDAWWQSRHELINSRATDAGNACQLVFIGDSITQAWENAGANVWRDNYEQYAAVNLGISGDQTQHVLWRLQNGNLGPISPSLAVIMIGTNNASGSQPIDTAAGITAIVDELHKQRPAMQILLLDVFPRGATADDRGRLINDNVNALIAKLDSRNLVDVLGIKDYFLSDTGLLSPKIMPDLLHLSELGYGLWRDGIKDYIRQHYAMEFLRENMPSSDANALSTDFLSNNVALAYAAFEKAPWRNTISDELFMNYVLPYAQLNEEREEWREKLMIIAGPIVKDCATTTEAALALNEKLFGELNVKYSTARNRADQAPSETIETGLASCTGLSILLADACRAVGVPARVAGSIGECDS